MSGKTGKTTANTLLEAVRESLFRAGRYDPGSAVPPAAILWTDADGQWEPLVSQLRLLMPELLTLGEYNPKERTGPAIWLRCVIERLLPDVELPEKTIPIIYMPNVNRQLLRAGEECPDSLKPLVELQYRGTVWTQRNGKDWTVEAFLVSEDGLGLDVAKDRETRQAMLRALSQLAVTPISRLRGKRLEAEDFDRLMIADTPRELLLWLSDPVHAREKWGYERWAAFCSRCRDEYGFDPEGEGELVAAEKLGMRETEVWQTLWKRYTESPALYPGIPNLLRRAKPARLIFDKEPWPDENETEENSLRQSLLELESLSSGEARKKIEELEKIHGTRRDWVWARLGQSPLAEALQHLVTLARKTAQGLGGDSPKAMADLYTEGGYLADEAVLKAISSVKSAEDARAIKAVLRSIYLPWLEDTARRFQDLVAGNPLPDKNQTAIMANPGQCLLFVDGLRFDIARRLVVLAEERQLRVTTGWRWAGLPTVTATAKPAVSPIAEKLSGDLPGEDFLPMIREGNLPLTTDRFRKLLSKAGYQVFNSSETGTPGEPSARGWTELGEFDRLGHALQTRLAPRIDEQLELVLDRIQALLDAGWKQVRVITDHGWLLVPGGLPAMKLPKYLTESRWMRCAAISPGARVDVPTAGWYWNTYQHFAFAPGVSCFINGNEYAHGGVSLQECLIPDLTFSSDSILAPLPVSIKEIQWLGMRCRVTVDAGSNEVTADLRTKPNEANSSITTPRQVDSRGRAGLLVADDSLEGTVVSLVLLDPAGRVIAKQTTTVGGED
ncbi:MAG: BREX-1 system phosphatase PglZ type B [Armatimonadetes bacterium]|nr:BREX-1 system phosphatase PglZ type B [Armatimonadota bacterium]